MTGRLETIGGGTAGVAPTGEAAAGAMAPGADRAGFCAVVEGFGAAALGEVAFSDFVALSGWAGFLPGRSRGTGTGSVDEAAWARATTVNRPAWTDKPMKNRVAKRIVSRYPSTLPPAESRQSRIDFSAEPMPKTLARQAVRDNLHFCGGSRAGKAFPSDGKRFPSDRQGLVQGPFKHGDEPIFMMVR
jgi:hypothetical protein